MQHGQTDWNQVARMWRTCPHARAVPGARVAYTDEREIQHALDAGALVIVVPTVDTVAEAIQARDWTYFPPLGRRSNGGGQAFDAAMWGGVPGGYRNTANDNIVLVLMIETLEGCQERRRDCEGARRERDLCGERRPRQLLRLSAGLTGLRTRDQHRARRGDQGAASGCADRSRGAIARTSRVSRPAVRRRRSRVVRRRSSATSRIRKDSRRWGRLRRSLRNDE